MLRLIVLALILLNAGYYAYAQGLLAAYGFGPSVQSEPHRMVQQIKPEALRVINVNPAGLPQSASSPNPVGATVSPTQCLQAGLFNDEQVIALRERVAGTLPQGSWTIESAIEPARWLVYMGKYANAEAVAKKGSELRGLGVGFEALGSPALEPGLSLGNFATQADADQALTLITRKGVKTARVVQERAELRGQRLKLPSVDAAMRSRLDGILPQLAGIAFKPCT